MKTARIAATALGALILSGAAMAQASDPDAVLIQALDRASKPGFLKTSSVYKSSDGTYHSVVSTGDAIAKPSFAKPREVIRTACTQSGGTLALLVSAGRTTPDARPVSLRIGSEQLTVARSDLYGLFPPFLGDDRGAIDRYGFRWNFRTSHFAERAGKQADADPPFGLFGCTLSNGATAWAAAILAHGEPRDYDVSVDITPVTRAWLAARRDRLADEETARRRSADAGRAEAAERIAREQAEAVRLKPFRAGLAVGSRTNCGLVIGVRGPLVQVQLPPHVTGPSGQREFWTPRAELTDAEAPRGCRFGG